MVSHFPDHTEAMVTVAKGIGRTNSSDERVKTRNFAMKSAPTRNEPVPDRDWTHAIRFCKHNNEC
ncbi:MAG: hypothetical protein FRX49_02297 [Trebouxia sp. A1-2]|nr:MAG: hypothetical protein FRX49_02297 [Trebouxia sp. A1-2]